MGNLREDPDEKCEVYVGAIKQLNEIKNIKDLDSFIGRIDKVRNRALTKLDSLKNHAREIEQQLKSITE